MKHKAVEIKFYWDEINGTRHYDTFIIDWESVNMIDTTTIYTRFGDYNIEREEYHRLRNILSELDFGV